MAAANEIRIDIKLNMLGLAKLQDLTKELVSLRNALAAAGKGVGPVAAGVAKMSTEMNTLRKASVAVLTSLTNAGKGSAALATSLGKATKASNAATNSANNLAKNITRIQKSAQGATTTIGKLRDRLSGIEKVMDPIFRAGFRMQMVGNDLYNVGRDIIRFIDSIMDKWGEFEFMMNRAAGAMGITVDMMGETFEGAGDSINIYDSLKESIMDAAQELRLFPAEDVAKATYFWASTTGQQIETLDDLRTAMEGINPIMKVAAMTETSYETAIKGVYSILVQYGKGLEETQSVTEKLHFITQRTAAEFPDLVNSFKMVGPVASALGETFEGVATAFGMLADAGIRGTMSGRALRQFFIQTIRPAAKAEKKMEELFGMDYQDIITDDSGKFVGLTGMIEQLAEKTMNLTDVQRLNILASISTANELPILTALVTKQIAAVKGLAGGWETAKYDITGAAKGFADSWEILANSWKGTVAQLERGLERIQLVIGSVLAEAFAPFIKQAGEIVDQLIIWVEMNPELIKIAGAIAGIGAAGLVAAGLVFKFMGGMIALSASVTNAVVAFGPLLVQFGLVVGIVGGVADAFIRNFEYIEDRVTEAIDTVVTAMGGVNEAGGATIDMVEGIVQAFRDFGDTVVISAADLLVSVADGLALILANKDAVNILKGIAVALAGIFAVNLAKGFMGAIASITGLKRALIGLGVVANAEGVKGGVLGKMNAALAAMPAGATRAQRAMIGLKGVMTGLGAALGGPMGIATLILGIGVAAYATNGDVKTLVDSMTDNFRNMKNEIQEITAEFGSMQIAAELASGRVVNQFSDIDEQIEALRGRNPNESFITLEQTMFDPAHWGDWARTVGEEIKRLEGMQLRAQDTLLEGWRATVAGINKNIGEMGRDLEANISLEEWLIQVREFERGLGMSFESAKGLTQDFFESVPNYAAATEDELRAFWNSTVWKGSADFNVFRGLTFNTTEVDQRVVAEALKANDNAWMEIRDRVLRDLMSEDTKLREVAVMDLSKFISFGQQGTLSNTFRAEIEGAMNRAALAGVEIVDEFGNTITQPMSDEMAKQMEAMRKELFETLTTGFTSIVTDMPKQMSELMKTAKMPTEKFGMLLKRLMSPKLTKGLTDKRPEVRMFAEDWLDGIMYTMETVMESGTDSEQAKMQARFNRMLQGWIPKDISPEQRAAIESLGGKVVTQADKAMTKKLKRIGASSITGANSPYNADGSLKVGGDTTSTNTVTVTPKIEVKDVSTAMQPYMAAVQGEVDANPIQLKMDTTDNTSVGTTALSTFQSGLNTQVAGIVATFVGIANAMKVTLGGPSGSGVDNTAYGSYALSTFQLGMASQMQAIIQTFVGITSAMAANLGPNGVGVDNTAFGSYALSTFRTGMAQHFQPILLISFGIANAIKAHLGPNGVGIDNTAYGSFASSSYKTGFASNMQSIIMLPVGIANALHANLGGPNGTGIDLAGYGAQTAASYLTGLTPPFGAAIEKAGTTVAGVLAHLNGKRAYSGGYSLADSWADGLNAGFAAAKRNADETAQYVADRLGQSMPKAGPLQHPRSGGFSIVQDWIKGQRRAIPDVKKSSKDVTNAFAMGVRDMDSAAFKVGGTFQQNRRTKHEVIVKVTSPDGSVNRTKTSELERALTMSAVWDELEHAITVG
jgi:TP901 family phage tail tape measure protein